MNHPLTVYLAGPEVFFPAAVRDHISARKRAILDSLGLHALSPCDNDPALDNAPDPAAAIYAANLDLMTRADGLIANLSPFRGPSADSGTVYELGYMIAAGKAAMGYSVCVTPYCDRVNPGRDTDSLGNAVEPFGLSDNLMLDCGLRQIGGDVLRGSQPWRESGLPPELCFEEALFYDCAARLKAQLID